MGWNGGEYSIIKNKLPAVSADSVFAGKTIKKEKNERRLLFRRDNGRSRQR